MAEKCRVERVLGSIINPMLTPKYAEILTQGQNKQGDTFLLQVLFGWLVWGFLLAKGSSIKMSHF